jgi:site-specific recombinase XerD
MTTRQLNRLFHEAADAAGIRKRVTLHALRHNAESRIMPSNLAMPLRSAQTKASVRSTGL